jgi:tyrosine-protein kinase Etk/Wzc
MVSIGLILLRVFLRRGIESPEQLEDIGINVYASVPVAETFSKSAQKSKKWSRKAETAKGLLQ